jgi:hypothetical protein
MIPGTGARRASLPLPLPLAPGSGAGEPARRDAMRWAKMGP